MSDILLFAYSQLGHDTLNFLIRHGYSIKGVVTHQDTQTEHIWFESVLDLAKNNNIPVFTPEKEALPGFLKTVEGIKPHLILSVYYRYMIPVSILNIPKLGAYNIHGSLLPHFRGRAPVNWAILKGATETGVTLHEMLEKPDAGCVVGMKSCPINMFDTAGGIMESLRPLAMSLLKEYIPKLFNQTAIKIPLNIKKGSYFSGRTPRDSEIHLNKMNAIDVHNLVRAMQPYPQYPAAYLMCEDKKILIHKTDPSDQPEIKELNQDFEFKDLYNDHDDNLWLKCSDLKWLKVIKFERI